MPSTTTIIIETPQKQAPVQDFGPLASAEDLCREIRRSVLKPRPRLSGNQWADTYRYLSPESSAAPGKFHSSNNPVMAEVLDACCDGQTRRVTLMASGQIGKTTTLENALAYFIHHEPSPILVIQPQLDMAQTFSKDRLAPMIRDTPVLTGLVRDVAGKAKKTGDTILHKQFPGGHITMAGSNSAASLASRPIRVLAMDELDKYDASAGKAGDPAALATKRTTTFWNKKILEFSTPLLDTTSRIEPNYLASDRRKCWVPCPHCGEYQVLEWGGKGKNYGVKWPEGHPEEAYYECAHCHQAIHDEQKMDMLRAHQWRAEVPFKGHAGFWIWEAYSVSVGFGEMALAWYESQRNPELLQQFFNESLARTWKDLVEEKAEPVTLKDRREVYAAEVPMGAVLLTAGVDVQGDRLECEVIAWGLGFENWSIRYDIIYGDPTDVATWDELDKVLLAEYRHESGVSLRVVTAFVDSGFSSSDVHKFTKKRESRGVYSSRGSSTYGHPIIKFRASDNNETKAKVFYIGTDAAKDWVYRRLRMNTEPGSNYMHFPLDRPNYDIQYFEQLVAEEVKVERDKKGYKRRTYVLPSGKRNEALDCRVYATAAFLRLRADMEAVVNTVLSRAEAMKSGNAGAPEEPQGGGEGDGGSWVKGGSGKKGWIHG